MSSDNTSSSSSSSIAPTVTKEQIDEIKKSLLDPSLSIDKRYRSVFTLRGIGSGLAVEALSSVLDPSEPSALLRHEVAYCLGQMGDLSAFPTLCKVLADVNEHPMVRHEAAEAIGALGGESEGSEGISVLQRFCNDGVKEVAETCQLALDRMKYYQTHAADSSSSVFLSVDPAPPHKPQPTANLRAGFLDRSLPIFERYRYLFALRDKGDKEAIDALLACFDQEGESSLLKHEVAFVLGQLQHEAAVSGLTKVLERVSEAAMVRHEAAEALGAIATEGCLPLLQKYAKDDERIVQESCIVALDVHDYLNNTEEFKYAEGLKILHEKNISAAKPSHLINQKNGSKTLKKKKKKKKKKSTLR
eukprot:TRINITY_DN4938_c0_g2_i1.p1 TRINITY_DN4938_c0_g2~~TRINITY_DN4938_c0_g2_i1.p1  ORF type:complete len:360 (-),score=61.11 TRINITY_DN4938_c0_g2_i1:34-1113(-)